MAVAVQGASGPSSCPYLVRTDSQAVNETVAYCLYTYGSGDYTNKQFYTVSSDGVTTIILQSGIVYEWRSADRSL